MSDIILQKSGANFFGFESVEEDGKKHSHQLVIRGNGELTLTKEGLYFIQWITKKEYFIPLKDVIKVEIGGSHNGKAQWPVKILKVYYRNMDQTLVFGASIGGKFSLTKGYKDEAVIWKEKIDEMLGKDQ